MTYEWSMPAKKTGVSRNAAGSAKSCFLKGLWIKADSLATERHFFVK